ncbi:hypothetical protein ABBQ38_000990 [Trebouxia sp. C0009 RCD-2024]
MVLQAFAEPWQQGTAAVPGQEVSSADAAVPEPQISQQAAGIVDGQAPYHAEMAPQPRHAVAHPQSANAHAAVSEQPSLPVSNEHEEMHEVVRAQENQGHHSDHGTFDIPATQFHEDDPSNHDGKLMSLLMG